jgi:hypothetical protein
VRGGLSTRLGDWVHRLSADAIAGTAVFAVAFAARLLPVFAFPGINHPDEVFQTMEQAHRLVFGNGLVPWEFVYGTRSWVLPGALAGLMMIASQFCHGPSCYMPIIGSALAALGAASALCGFLWGRRFFGTAGGVIAGIFAAIWIDAVYFGPRTLSDSVAAHVLVIGLYANTPSQPEATTWRRAAVAVSAARIPWQRPLDRAAIRRGRQVHLELSLRGALAQRHRQPLLRRPGEIRDFSLVLVFLRHSRILDGVGWSDVGVVFDWRLVATAAVHRGPADRGDLLALRTQGAAVHLSGRSARGRRQRHRPCSARRVD